MITPCLKRDWVSIVVTGASSHVSFVDLGDGTVGQVAAFIFSVGYFYHQSEFLIWGFPGSHVYLPTSTPFLSRLSMTT